MSAPFLCCIAGSVPVSKVTLLLGGPFSKALPACDLLTFPPPAPSSLAC